MPIPYVEYGNKDKEAAMTPEQDNKATVGRLYEAFRAGDTAAPNGLDASKALFAQVGAIDADLHRMVAEGDLVAVHAHYKTPAETAGMDFFKLRDGKIVEHWDVIQDLPERTASGQDMFSELS